MAVDAGYCRCCGSWPYRCPDIRSILEPVSEKCGRFSGTGSRWRYLRVWITFTARAVHGLPDGVFRLVRRRGAPARYPHGRRHASARLGRFTRDGGQPLARHIDLIGENALGYKCPISSA